MQSLRCRSYRHLLGITSALVLCGILYVSGSMAATPRKISYQGVLTDSNGTPLADGQYQMRFRLYDAATDGNLLWTEEWTGDSKVTVNAGLFNVLLGTIEPINLGTLTFADTYWLEVAVYNTGSSSYEILSPRHELASAAYALRAAKVENGAIDEYALGTNSVTDDKIVTLSATKLTGTIDNARINWAAPGSIGTSTAGVGYFTDLFASGNVGIGTTNPGAKLDVNGGAIRFDSGHLVTNCPNGAMVFNCGPPGLSGSTGFHFRSNNVLGDPSLYSNLMVISPNGKVGIGTTSPDVSLQVGAETTVEDSHSIRIQGSGNFAAPDTIYTSLDFFHKLSAGNNQATARILSRGKNSAGTPGGLEFYMGDWNNNEIFQANPSMVIRSTGNVGIGTTDPGYKLDVNGTIKGTGYACPGADLAEKLSVRPDYELSDEELKTKISKLDLSDMEKQVMVERKEISKLDPGTVVVISKGGVIPCAEENDTRLAGIASTSPAVKMASEKKGQYIALAGKVPCKVTGKIKAGDMLTTSAIEGHAQKAEQPVLGAIVGKALEDSDGERGVIDVWVGGCN